MSAVVLTASLPNGEARQGAPNDDEATKQRVELGSGELGFVAAVSSDGGDGLR